MSLLLDDLGSSVGEAIEMSLLLLMGGEGVRVHLCLFEPLFGEELVDAGGVLGPLDFWLEWHLVLLCIDGIPIDVREERMLLQVICIIIATNAFGRIPFKKLLEEACGLLTEVRFHGYGLLGNVSQHLLAITVVVGWTATEHLVEQGSQAPPVCSPRMTRSLDDLRSQILWSSAKTVRLVRLLYALLRKTKVCDSNMTLRIQ